MRIKPKKKKKPVEQPERLRRSNRNKKSLKYKKNLNQHPLLIILSLLIQSLKLPIPQMVLMISKMPIQLAVAII